jgi:hypothetical protein
MHVDKQESNLRAAWKVLIALGIHYLRWVVIFNNKQNVE